MTFFLVQQNFGGNLYSTYVLKVFLAGISRLGRRNRPIKHMPEMPLKVQRPLTDVPQAYELSKKLKMHCIKVLENSQSRLQIQLICDVEGRLTETYSLNIFTP